jgi:hypothetical protein
MVSHDLNMAAMYADRLLLLSRGHHRPAWGRPIKCIDFELLEKGLRLCRYWWMKARWESIRGCTWCPDACWTGHSPLFQHHLDFSCRIGLSINEAVRRLPWGA